MFSFSQKLQKRHVLRRRGKGEASFLHCKPPGREEVDVTNRGRGMGSGKQGEKEGGKIREKQIKEEVKMVNITVEKNELLRQTARRNKDARGKKRWWAFEQ